MRTALWTPSQPTSHLARTLFDVACGQVGDVCDDAVGGFFDTAQLTLQFHLTVKLDEFVSQRLFDHSLIGEHHPVIRLTR